MWPPRAGCWFHLRGALSLSSVYIPQHSQPLSTGARPDQTRLIGLPQCHSPLFLIGLSTTTASSLHFVVLLFASTRLSLQCEETQPTHYSTTGDLHLLSFRVCAFVFVGVSVLCGTVLQIPLATQLVLSLLLLFFLAQIFLQGMPSLSPFHSLSLSVRRGVGRVPGEMRAPCRRGERKGEGLGEMGRDLGKGRQPEVQFP